MQRMERMTGSRVVAFAVVAIGLGACGSAGAGRHTTTAADEAKASGKASDDESPGVSYGADPLLTVYVAGPHPDANLDAAAGAFDTIVTVVNEGAVPARLGTARAHFEVWVADQQRDCATVDPIEAPLFLLPYESYTWETRALCPVTNGELDDVEVRTYVHFGAAGGDVAVERHYAGRYVIR